MGQLEKYGLYVLVVVIFLILGVAIWGGEPQSREDLASIEIDDGRNDRPQIRIVDPAGGGDSGPFIGGDELDDGGGQQEDAAEDDGPIDPADVLDGDEQESDDEEGGSDGEQESPESADDDRQPRERIHRIARGDTFTSIAEEYYGNGNLYGLIAEANPDLDPTNLREGVEVVVPPRAEQPGGSSPTPPATSSTSRVHVMKSGETFSALAKRYYGDANRYQRIVDANPDLDPARLKPGTEVVVPPASSGADQE